MWISKKEAGDSPHLEDEHCLFSMKDVRELNVEQVGVLFWNLSRYLNYGLALYFLEDGLQMFGVKEQDGKLVELGCLRGVLANL